MTMDVTEYSLADLEVIKLLLSKKTNDIKRELPNQKEFLFRYTSIQFPTFFFELSRTDNSTTNGDITYQMIIKPFNDINVGTGQAGRNLKGVITLFEIWLERIDRYSELHIATNNIQDSILEQSEEEILDWFELVEEDAGTKSYDIKTQLLIDKIANNVIEAVNGYEGEISDDDRKILLAEARELKDIQTTLPKTEVVKRISKLWARTKKVSITLFKEALKDLIKDGIKGLLKGEFNGTITYLLS